MIINFCQFKLDDNQYDKVMSSSATSASTTSASASFPLSSKRALIILTNQNYLPLGGYAPCRTASASSAENVYARQPLSPEAGTKCQQTPQCQCPSGTCSSPSSSKAGPMFTQPPQTFLPCRLTTQEPPSTYQPQSTGGTSTTNQSASVQYFQATHSRTGIDILQLGKLWSSLRNQNGMEITLATPQGGSVSISPCTAEALNKDERLRTEIWNDSLLMSSLGHTVPISWINPREYNLALVLGCRGALYDLPEHPDVAIAISEIYNNQQAQPSYVGAIGHGIAGLLNARLEVRKPNSPYLLAGRKVCSFSEEEERALGEESSLPYFLDQKLAQRGALLQNKKAFEPNCQTDNRIITAQNPASLDCFVETVTREIGGQFQLRSNEAATASSGAAAFSQPLSQTSIPARMRRE